MCKIRTQTNQWPQVTTNIEYFFGIYKFKSVYKTLLSLVLSSYKEDEPIVTESNIF